MQKCGRSNLLISTRLQELQGGFAQAGFLTQRQVAQAAFASTVLIWGLPTPSQLSLLLRPVLLLPSQPVWILLLQPILTFLLQLFLLLPRHRLRI